VYVKTKEFNPWEAENTEQPCLARWILNVFKWC